MNSRFPLLFLFHSPLALIELIQLLRSCDEDNPHQNGMPTRTFALDLSMETSGIS